MAEGFAKNLNVDQKYQIHSAGVEAHGLNPLAVEVMKELGIDISNQHSRKIKDEDLFHYDLVITLCGDARDRCPLLTSNTKNIHWDLQDPAKAKGSDKEIISTYRKVRDQILLNVKSRYLKLKLGDI